MKSLLLLLDISNFVYICLSVLSIIVEANCVPVPWGSDAIVSHWDDIKFVFNQIEKWGGDMENNITLARGKKQSFGQMKSKKRK